MSDFPDADCSQIAQSNYNTQVLSLSVLLRRKRGENDCLEVTRSRETELLFHPSKRPRQRRYYSNRPSWTAGLSSSLCCQCDLNCFISPIKLVSPSASDARPQQGSYQRARKSTSLRAGRQLEQSRLHWSSLIWIRFNGRCSEIGLPFQYRTYVYRPKPLNLRCCGLPDQARPQRPLRGRFLCRLRAGMMQLGRPQETS